MANNLKENKIEKTSNNKESDNFNIIITYSKNGKSFQSIAENIILRKMNESI